MCVRHMVFANTLFIPPRFVAAPCVSSSRTRFRFHQVHRTRHRLQLLLIFFFSHSAVMSLLEFGCKKKFILSPHDRSLSISSNLHPSPHALHSFAGMRFYEIRECCLDLVGQSVRCACFELFFFSLGSSKNEWQLYGFYCFSKPESMNAGFKFYDFSMLLDFRLTFLLRIGPFGIKVRNIYFWSFHSLSPDTRRGPLCSTSPCKIARFQMILAAHFRWGPSSHSFTCVSVDSWIVTADCNTKWIGDAQHILHVAFESLKILFGISIFKWLSTLRRRSTFVCSDCNAHSADFGFRRYFFLFSFFSTR